MDGYSLKRRLRQLLNESSTSDYIDTGTSYDFIFDAVVAYVERTGAYTGSQTVTTVAETRTYNLDPQFLSLFQRDDDNRLFLHLMSGSTKLGTLYFREYGIVLFDYNTSSKVVPDTFSVIEGTAIDNITGTTSADGADANGEATLTDTSSTTKFANVAVGDKVINSSDSSHGYVVSKTSNTVLICSLLDGTDNDWTSGDSYVIIPQQRYALYLDPPPSTSGYTMTVPYTKRPDPVYSDYRTYPLPKQVELTIVQYAAWLYKYRDREPNFGDAWFKHFDEACRQNSSVLNMSKQRSGFRVNMRKIGTRIYGSRR